MKVRTKQEVSWRCALGLGYGLGMLAFHNAAVCLPYFRSPVSLSIIRPPCLLPVQGIGLLEQQGTVPLTPCIVHVRDGFHQEIAYCIYSCLKPRHCVPRYSRITFRLHVYALILIHCMHLFICSLTYSQ